MSHWAEIDENNIVLRVLVGDNNDPNGDEGYQWLINNLGGTWVKTSYNGTIRKNFAGIGYTYDPIRDAFIEPKPYVNSVLDEETCKWYVPQVPLREDSVWKLVEDEDGSRLVLKDKVTISQPFASWTLDENTSVWMPPVAYPTDGKFYRWDESTLSWIEIAP
jgi:hypothetical protein